MLDRELNSQAALFRLLSGLFFRELTAQDIALYREGAAEDIFLAAGRGTRVRQAVADFRTAIDAWPDQPDLTRDLSVEYARLFLLFSHDSAAPYASAYLEADGHLAGAPHARMQARLAAAGMALATENGEPLDHLSIMLEHLADLCAQPSAHAEAGAFVADELLPWTGRFSSAVAKAASPNSIYAAAARLCDAVLREYL